MKQLGVVSGLSSIVAIKLSLLLVVGLFMTRDPELSVKTSLPVWYIPMIYQTGDQFKLMSTVLHASSILQSLPFRVTI